MTAPVLYLAKSTALPDGPRDIQIFPPGRQVVQPSKLDGSLADEMELVIDEAAATALEERRAIYQAKADAGEGDAPFIDFNHDDGEAAAWPKRIYWAGDDPLLGGVRAEVEWSSAGEQAVRGKTFRRFSPVFMAHEGRITGAPVNMGGLVNRAAFQKIQPLFAKGAPETSPEETDPSTTMTEEEIESLKEENATLKQQLADLQTKVDDMTLAAKESNRKDAEAAVALAAKEGRIPPAKEVQDKWVAAIEADPSAKDLLLAMAPNPALAGTIIKGAPPQDPEAEEPVKAKAGIAGLADVIAAKRGQKTQD